MHLYNYSIFSVAKEDRRMKWLWPGEFLHFILHKTNIDTMQAALNLSSKLG